MRRFLLLAPLLLLASCLGDRCEPKAERACFTGPGLADTGICRSGTQVCTSGGAWGPCSSEVVATDETCDGIDEDCDGTPDNGVSNVCGGCSVPMGSPGESCRRDDDCPGTWTCEGGDLVCAGPAKNACGVCGGVVLDGKGDACTAADGCPGTLACNTAGNALSCTAAPKNACGVCGGPTVTGLGNSCTDGEGCSGVLACNETGRGTRCNATAVNECGVCGGPPVSGVGGSCTKDGCSGTVACTAQGTTVCSAPAKDACGVCGGNVTSIGGACTATNGCAGTFACATGGSVCQAPAKNACGVCGGPAIGPNDGCDGGPAHATCLGPATGLPITSKPRSEVTATTTTLDCAGTLSCTAATTLEKHRCRDGFTLVLIDGATTVNVRFKADGSTWTAGATVNGQAPTSGGITISGLRVASDPVPQVGNENAAEFFLSVGSSTLNGDVVARW